jgi:hypothetical protein
MVTVIRFRVLGSKVHPPPAAPKATRIQDFPVSDPVYCFLSQISGFKLHRTERNAQSIENFNLERKSDYQCHALCPMRSFFVPNIQNPKSLNPAPRNVQHNFSKIQNVKFRIPPSTFRNPHSTFIYPVHPDNP